MSQAERDGPIELATGVTGGRADPARDLAKALQLEEEGKIAEAARLYRAAVEDLERMVGAEQDSAARVRILVGPLKLFRERAVALEAFVEAQRRDLGLGPECAVPLEAIYGPGCGDRVAALEAARERAESEATWNTLCGLDEAATMIREQVVLFARFPQLFAKKARPWRGVLLHGPPRTGKRFMLGALAELLRPLAPEFAVLWCDCRTAVTDAKEGPAGVRKVFACAQLRASRGQRSVILVVDLDLVAAKEPDDHVVLLQAGQKFISDSHAAAQARDELLLGMRQVAGAVPVVATSSKPWNVDAALRRRFDRRIVCKPLDERGVSDLVSARLAIKSRGGVPRQPDVATNKAFSAALSRGLAQLPAGLACEIVERAIDRPLRECQRATAFQPVAHDSQLQVPVAMEFAAGEEPVVGKLFLQQPCDRIFVREPTEQDAVAILSESAAQIAAGRISDEDLKPFERAFAS